MADSFLDMFYRGQPRGGGVTDARAFPGSPQEGPARSAVSVTSLAERSAGGPCGPTGAARCENRRSGAAPCQCIVSGGILTISPGFSTCGFSPLKQMRPTPDKQKSVCPTGWECHAVHAPGVNVTTEPPRRDGASAVITGSWNTIPVKVSAAPSLVVRASGANDPGFYWHDVLLPKMTASRPPNKRR